MRAVELGYREVVVPDGVSKIYPPLCGTLREGIDLLCEHEGAAGAHGPIVGLVAVNAPKAELPKLGGEVVVRLA